MSYSQPKKQRIILVPKMSCNENYILKKETYSSQVALFAKPELSNSCHDTKPKSENTTLWLRIITLIIGPPRNAVNMT